MARRLAPDALRRRTAMGPWVKKWGFQPDGLPSWRRVRSAVPLGFDKNPAAYDPRKEWLEECQNCGGQSCVGYARPSFGRGRSGPYRGGFRHGSGKRRGYRVAGPGCRSRHGGDRCPGTGELCVGRRHCRGCPQQIPVRPHRGAVPRSSAATGLPSACGGLPAAPTRLP